VTAPETEAVMTDTNQDPLPPLDTAQRYTIPEAKRYLRTSHQTIYNLIAKGELGTITEGRRRFVPGSEIARRSALPAA